MWTSGASEDVLESVNTWTSGDVLKRVWIRGDVEREWTSGEEYKKCGIVEMYLRGCGLVKTNLKSGLVKMYWRGVKKLQDFFA